MQSGETHGNLLARKRAVRLGFGFVIFVVACGDAGPGSNPLPMGDAGTVIDAQIIQTDAAVKPKPDAGSTPPVIPDIDAIPWDTSANVGFGIASKDTKNPLGNSMFVAYAGYGVSLALAETWASAMYKSELASRGVGRIWAVQGPNTPSYSNLEIGNSKIADAMVPAIDGATQFVLVMGHSSGSFVAHELLEQLAGSFDPGGATDHKIVYFDLDGGGGFTDAAIAHTEHAFFVGAHDGATSSPNHDDMASLGSAYASKGGFYDNDSGSSGCDAGAEWCVHISLINAKPHDPTNADPSLDYGSFGAQHPLATGWLDAKAKAAGID